MTPSNNVPPRAIRSRRFSRSSSLTVRFPRLAYGERFKAPRVVGCCLLDNVCSVFESLLRMVGCASWRQCFGTADGRRRPQRVLARVGQYQALERWLGAEIEHIAQLDLRSTQIIDQLRHMNGIDRASCLQLDNDVLGYEKIGPIYTNRYASKEHGYGELSTEGHSRLRERDYKRV